MLPWWQPRKALLATVLALLITAFGGLLRLDALVGRYGSLDHPAWARAVTHDIAPIGAALRPSSIGWTLEDNPYVGGDPINYLKYAREMQGFYQAHVREPVFLALTRTFLWALDDQDIAVSFASVAGSTLAVFATYLLGAAMGSRIAGLLAALLLAIEFEAIGWAPEGWRDDTFTATVLLAAWALLRLYREPTIPNAGVAGLLSGLSCLTRITALSFIVPALLWILLARTGKPRRERALAAAVALAVAAVVVAPYLISCALATGDPLYAINYHTIYYRHAEGQPIDAPMSAAEYLRTKIVDRPVGTLDTAMNGLFVHPFTSKWNGFSPWTTGVGGIVRALAAIGLGILLLFAAGRVFLLILFASLVPYMVTWNVGGGAEWRFTMHAYPFYLVAAACVVAWSGRAIARARQAAQLPVSQIRPLAFRAAAVILLVSLGVAAYYTLPWLVTREAIASGEATSVEASPRDWTFFSNDWSDPHEEGVTVRISRGRRSTMRVPLIPGRDYEMTVRLDPVDPAKQRAVWLLVNGTLTAVLKLTWDPERVGSYHVALPADRVQRINELTFIPDTLVTAGSAGPHFAWLDPREQLGVRLWYVRVLPH